MAEQKSTFQSMNSCAACKHTTDKDPTGMPAAAYGKSYWCPLFGKGVDAKDGAACPNGEYAA